MNVGEPRQTQFDIPRLVEQSRLLDAVSFASVERNGVGKTTLKGLLRRIGSMRELCESQHTLAKIFEVSREHICRAIRVLESLDLITSTRKYNTRYDRVLNHHRVNWGELHRFIGGQLPPESAPDQCDDFSSCNVMIPPEQCDDFSSTNVMISQTVLSNTNSVETTTTEPNWESVVVVLSDILDCGSEAIRRMQSRKGTPTQAMELIQRWQALPLGDKTKKPGTLYNWFCREPKPPTTPRPAKPVKTPDQLRENHRVSTLNSIRSQMIRERGRPLSDVELSILESSVIDEMEKYDATHTRISDTKRKAAVV